MIHFRAGCLVVRVAGECCLALVFLLCMCLVAFLACRAQAAENVIHSFQGQPNDGFNPVASLVVGADGNFYGTTEAGGSNDEGTVFKITPAGIATVLHDFSDGTVPNDGISPEAALIVGSDGNLYGTTLEGGTANHGTVFRITPGGNLAILHGFGSLPNDGARPAAALYLGADGNLYGTTVDGGSDGMGTVFKITPVGTETVLHSFRDETVNNDGTHPVASLIQGDDGYLYGTTEEGGSVGDGTIFKMTPHGTETVLHRFGDGTVAQDGSHPESALVSGADGNLYGTTYDGGDGFLADEGTVFRVTPAGSETVLHSFQGYPADGSNPTGALALGADGSFYGTTSSGGLGEGTIFRIASTGTETVLHDFGDGTVAHDGSQPQAALVLGRDGNFYGTTEYGGSDGYDGTVFRFPEFASFTWSAKDVAAATDGTSRLLWTRSDGAAGVWTLNTAGVQTVVGPTYGPYAGWTAKALSVSGDGTTRLLWTNTNGEAGVWTLNSADAETTIGTTYGPYTGWSAADIATASNGASRVLWTNTSGAAGVWTFSAADIETTIGTTYGPYTGWTAKAVGAAGDGTARMLWTNTNGMAGLWTLNSADAQTTVGTTCGPYAGWTASGLGTSSDGTSNVLWTNVSGAAGVWTFNAADVKTLVGTTYGPYPGYTASAMDVAGDASRVLWVRPDRAAGVWSFGSNDVESVIGTVYGPY